MHTACPHYLGASEINWGDGKPRARCALTTMHVHEDACVPDCVVVRAKVRGRLPRPVPVAIPVSRGTVSGAAGAAGATGERGERRVTGAEIWAEMHGLARDFAGDPAPFKGLIARLPALLSGMGCSCWREFAAYLYDHPPAYESAEALQRWTWAAHNAVNARLGRAAWTWEAARERWGWREEGPKK